MLGLAEVRTDQQDCDAQELSLTQSQAEKARLGAAKPSTLLPSHLSELRTSQRGFTEQVAKWQSPAATLPCRIPLPEQRQELWVCRGDPSPGSAMGRMTSSGADTAETVSKALSHLWS